MSKKAGKKSKVGVDKATSEYEDRKAAFLRWLELIDSNPNKAATSANVKSSTIYNFLKGSSKSLSSIVLSKLAAANNSSVDDILTGQKPIDKAKAGRHYVPVLFRVGARGSMFVCEDKLVAAAPAGVEIPDGVSAAVVDTDDLGLIGNGWTVYFRNEPSDPSTLEGKAAAVRYSGGGDRPAIRTIQRSQFDGLWSLKAADGTMTEDVKIVAAHEIVAYAMSKVSEE